MKLEDIAASAERSVNRNATGNSYAEEANRIAALQVLATCELVKTMREIAVAFVSSPLMGQE